MRRAGIVALLLAASSLSACGGGGGTPQAADSPTDCYPSATLPTDAAPSSATGQPEAPCGTDLPDGEESTEGAGATGTSAASGTTAPAGAEDVGCLTSRTWHISKPDLESQMQHLMSAHMHGGAQVDSVQVASGDQTLTVTPGLRATFTDDTVTVIKAHFTEHGTRIDEVTKQTHAGTASGAWQARNGVLTPRGAWSGGITVTTQVTVNGRSGTSTTSAAPDAWSDLKLTYSCADGSLMLTVPGTSPFSYLFR